MSPGRRPRGATRKRGGSVKGVKQNLPRASVGASLGAMWRRTGYTLKRSFTRLFRQPISSAMTIGVVGIALCLPTALYLGLSNLKQATEGVTGPGELALFLTPGTTEPDALALAESLSSETDIQFAHAVSPEQGLTEIEATTGLSDAVAALDENPLPWLIRVIPADKVDVEPLAGSLSGREGVDSVRFDREWLTRLNALLEVASRLTVILAGLLGLAVLLVVGNTIRLEIQQCRTEIEVSKLLGASDGFVRRPFLLGGAWVGLLGGVMALMLVLLAIYLLQEPVGTLASSYGSSLAVEGPSLWLAGIVLMTGATTGFLGAWLAVGRHLSAIEPS